jgi:hypothetical protein
VFLTTLTTLTTKNNIGGGKMGGRFGYAFWARYKNFPPPWSVGELDACYVVIDSAGRELTQYLWRAINGVADVHRQELPSPGPATFDL